MVTQFRSLAPSDTLQRATEELLAGAQQDFPVLEDGRLVGMLWRRDIFTALKQGGIERSVRDFIDPNCQGVSPNDLLEHVLENMRQDACPATPVVHNGKLVGLVTNENLVELMTIRAVLRDSKPPHENLMRPSQSQPAKPV
jgi:predicted transcriptional regulator